MIVLPPGIFRPKMIVLFIWLARILRLQVKYFGTKLSTSISLSTPQLPRVFQISFCFIYFKSHTYNYSVKDQGALILPKLRTRTIILRRRECIIYTNIRHNWVSDRGIFLIIIGWNPSVCKSNWLHVNILRFSFIKLGLYSINSPKMIGNLPTVFNFNQLFLKLNQFICN